jgi:hypothetical protein
MTLLALAAEWQRDWYVARPPLALLPLLSSTLPEVGLLIFGSSNCSTPRFRAVQDSLRLRICNLQSLAVFPLRASRICLH